jgi:hypothetical protein
MQACPRFVKSGSRHLQECSGQATALSHRPFRLESRASPPQCAYARAAASRRQEESAMAKGQKKSNKEIRKPKAEKPKTNAANASSKGLIKDANR